MLSGKLTAKLIVRQDRWRGQVGHQRSDAGLLVADASKDDSQHRDDRNADSGHVPPLPRAGEGEQAGEFNEASGADNRSGDQ